MPKNRRTRQKKIILQLKRRLSQQTSFPSTSQEANSIEPKSELSLKINSKNNDNALFSYNPALIKKDLLKTLILSLLVISFEIVLYLRLG